jgi:hypothetical protein
MEPCESCPKVGVEPSSVWETVKMLPMYASQRVRFPKGSSPTPSRYFWGLVKNSALISVRSASRTPLSVMDRTARVMRDWPRGWLSVGL